MLWGIRILIKINLIKHYLIFLKTPSKKDPYLEIKNMSKSKPNKQITRSWLITYIRSMVGPEPFPYAQNRWEEAILGFSVLLILIWIIFTNLY